MYPVIIMSMVELNRSRDEIQLYIDKAEKLLADGYVKEKLIIQKYVEAKELVEGNGQGS